MDNQKKEKEKKSTDDRDEAAGSWVVIRPRKLKRRRPLLCVHAYHHFAVIIIKAISLWKAAKGKKMSIFSPAGFAFGTHGDK